METFMLDDGGLRVGLTCVSWDRVNRVAIRTTADGPWSEDLSWLFVTSDAVFELGHAAMQGERLELLQRHLPGLDNAAIVQAMGSTEHDLFFVYDRLGARATTEVLRHRFNALVVRLGGRADDTVDRLLAAWSDPARAYHGRLHLAECLDLLDRHAPRASDLVELALWFHDAVYDPRANDNEERSAAWLCACGRALGLSGSVTERAAALVRATAHFAHGPTDAGPDADLVRDIDLAILASDPLRFLAFERGIRREYAHVGDLRFGLGRGAFLDGLLASPVIFRTPSMASAFETRARANLAAALASPTYRAYRWLRSGRRLVSGTRPSTGPAPSPRNVPSR